MKWLINKNELQQEQLQFSLRGKTDEGDTIDKFNVLKGYIDIYKKIPLDPKTRAINDIAAFIAIEDSYRGLARELNKSSVVY